MAIRKILTIFYILLVIPTAPETLSKGFPLRRAVQVPKSGNYSSNHAAHLFPPHHNHLYDVACRLPRKCLRGPSMGGDNVCTLPHATSHRPIPPASSNVNTPNPLVRLHLHTSMVALEVPGHHPMLNPSTVGSLSPRHRTSWRSSLDHTSHNELAEQAKLLTHSPSLFMLTLP